MTDTARTLADLFLAGNDDETAAALQRAEGGTAFARLKSRISEAARSLTWADALGEVSGALPDLLDIGVDDILVGAWKKGTELRKYADPEQTPPGDTLLVEMVDHTVSSTHRPHLDVYVDEQKIARVDFEVSVSVAIEGAVLKIRGGRIHEARTGTLRATGAIKCEGQPIIEKESRVFELPGKIELEEPMEIESGAE